MNEKINYFNVFFRQDAGRVPLIRWQVLADTLPSRKILYGNRKFSDFTGLDLVRLKESDVVLDTLFHKEDQAFVERVLSTARELTPLGHCPVRLADGFGRYHYHELRGNALKKDDKGNGQLILFVAQDIADALKSKEEMETTRELLDETEELLQFGSWAWDINTNTITWTSGLYALLGYTRQEVADKIGFDFYLSHLLEEYAQSFQEIVQRALREKTDFSYEYVLKTNTGALKNISTSGRLVKNEEGEVIKMLCINRDVTAMRSFEKEQERSFRELNRSNRDLEEFAYIASHDLQEPLRKISMFTERLKAKYDKSLDKEGELFIERILLSAANMRTLIDNLLDFSRANRRSNTFDQVNIKTIFDNVVSELELKIEETEAVINFSGTFPTLEAVTSEMTQLFSNILSNAIKFRKHNQLAEINVSAGRLGKSEKHVLGLSPASTFYKIDVQDNGIGFEPEYAEKIFQIFQRLNGKSEYPGSGIGLAICKKIVEKHNGLIFANSQPDQGATFTIILPEKQF